MFCDARLMLNCAVSRVDCFTQFFRRWSAGLLIYVLLGSVHSCVSYHAGDFQTGCCWLVTDRFGKTYSGIRCGAVSSYFHQSQYIQLFSLIFLQRSWFLVKWALIFQFAHVTVVPVFPTGSKISEVSALDASKGSNLDTAFCFFALMPSCCFSTKSGRSMSLFIRGAFEDEAKG